MKPSRLFIILICAGLFISFNCYASTYYWKGSVNNNWSTLGNWALSSCGGSTPGSLPGSGDSVVFSGSCSVVNCTIDASINVLSLRVDNAYTGTITQGSGKTVTIAIGRFTGGTYTGSSDAITFSTSLKMDGGIFTASSGTTTIKGNFTFTSGTFNHNNGRTIFASTLTISGSGTLTLYDAEFQASVGNTTITLSKSITVNDSTLLTGSNQLFINSSNSSVINTTGDVKITNSSTTGGGSASIVMNGTTDQHLTNVSTTEDKGKLPNLTINKSSGTLYLSGFITMGGSTTLTYTAGTVNAGTSTVVFYFTNTITGNMIFNNIEFQGTISTFTVSNTITVNGNVTLISTGRITLTSGTINIYGNIIDNNTAAAGGGSTILNFTGTANDSIISSVSAEQGNLGYVHINKTGGTLYLSGIINVIYEWLNYAPSTDIDPGTSTLNFFYLANGNNINIGGSYPTPAYNVTFTSIMNNDNYYYNIESDSTLSISHKFTLAGNAVQSLNGHSINIRGNLKITNTKLHSSIYGGGTSILNFVGSANDSIISTVSIGEGLLGNVYINKPGGTLYLSGNIDVVNSWMNYTASSQINPGTSTLAFANVSSGGVTIGGTHITPVWNVNFGVLSDQYSSTYSIQEDSAFSVKNNLTISNDAIQTFSGHSLDVLGNITITNTVGGGGGTSVFYLSGSANDSIVASSGLVYSEGNLPAVVINKSGGTLYLGGIITNAGGWTYLNGNVNAGSSTVGLGATNTVIASQTSSYMTFNNVQIGGTAAVITLGSNLHVGGDLTINHTLNTSSSNYQIMVGGNWINNGTYTGNNSDVTFNGSVNDSIKGSSNTSFYSLTINKTGTLYLADPTTVTHTLTLTSGDILSSSTNLLTLNNGATTSGANDASFVNGPIKKIGNAAFTFPTGTGSSYHSIGITAPSNTTDAFTAQYFNTGQTHGSTSDSLTYESTCDYWNLTRTTGSSNVKVTLGWGTNSCAINRLSTLRVGYWNSSTSKWMNLGQSANTGSTTTGSVTAATTSTSFGDFTIGKNSPTPTVSAGSATSICKGSSTTIGGSPTATGGFSPYTYSWSPSTSISNSTISNPSASPTTTTTYTVTVHDNDNAPTATGTVAVTVNPVPTITTIPSSVCKNVGTTLTASGAVSYTWSPSTGLSGTTGSSVTSTIATNTTYTIIGTGSDGCTTTKADSISVNTKCLFTIKGDGNHNSNVICNCAPSQ